MIEEIENLTPKELIKWYHNLNSYTTKLKVPRMRSRDIFVDDLYITNSGRVKCLESPNWSASFKDIKTFSKKAYLIINSKRTNNERTNKKNI